MSIAIEKFDDRIRLHAPWAPGLPAKCKAVPGARWAAEASAKYWSYPLTLDVCRQLRRVFGDDLVIGPELTAWARHAVAQEKKMASLSALSDADLALVPSSAPRMASAMGTRTYQRVGARFLAEAAHTGGVANWDEPSLGKTIVTLGGLIEAGMWHGMHLVAAPKTSLESVWFDQIHKWAGETGVGVVYMPEGKAKREEALQTFMDMENDPKFLVVNPEMLQVKIESFCKKCNLWEKEIKALDYQDEVRLAHNMEKHKVSPEISKCAWPDLFQISWTSVTIDEAHKYLGGIRGPQARQQSQTGIGAMRLKADLRIALTGTPFRGRVKNVWGMLHWLRPREYTSLWQWAELFLEIRDNGFGKEIGQLRPAMEEDFFRSLDRIAIRRTKREVRADLPHNIWQEHWVSMYPKQAKQYNDLLKEAETLIGDTMVSPTGVLAELTRLKQVAYGEQALDDSGRIVPAGKSPKLDLVVDMLAERGVTGDPETEDGEMKFVIASQFTRVIESVQRTLNGLGIETSVITGDVTGAKRTAATAQFNAPGGPRVMLINTLAGGVAIDLDTYCDEMFILDETWVPDEQKQLEGRIDNRGDRVAPRVFHYIRTRDTVEEHIAQINIDKDNLQQAILDKRRGIEIARMLLGRRAEQ